MSRDVSPELCHSAMFFFSVLSIFRGELTLRRLLIMLICKFFLIVFMLGVEVFCFLLDIVLFIFLLREVCWFSIGEPEASGFRERLELRVCI